VVIDGIGREWPLYETTDDSGFVFSVQNDDKNLYLYVAPTDKDSKTLLSSAFDQNFSVWLDMNGSKQKDLGIKLVSLSRGGGGGPSGRQSGHVGGAMPQGANQGGMQKPPQGDMPSDGEQPPDMNNAEGGSMPSGGPQNGPSADSKMVSSSTGTFALIGFPQDGGNASRADRVQIAIGDVSHRGVFEARIPLDLLGGTLPAKFNVGFEADALPSSKSSGGRSFGGSDGESGGHGGPHGAGGPPSGGMGGAGGPPPGGMGGAGGPGGQSGDTSSLTTEEPEPLSVWLNVSVAK